MTFCTETSQPLVVNTDAATISSPDAESVEAEESLCIQSFLTTTCGCSVHDGRPCSANFSIDHYLDVRGQCKELTRGELDMALLGHLTFTSSHTCRTTTYRHPSSAPRQHSYTTFMHGGVKVCRKTFVFLHSISEKKLKNLKSSLLENGLSPRLHGNTKCLPHNTTSFADTQQVANFIKTYAEAHAILLPGRIPGYKRSDLQLLPSSTTKRNVWRLYCDSLETLSTTHHRVSFCAMWQKLVPHIMVTKPMTDVCQKNSVAIMRAANQPDELKSEVYK